jgi:hypothetical protein
MSKKTSPIQLYDSDDDDDLLTQPDFLEGWEAPSPSKAEKRGGRRRGQSPEKLAAKRTKDDSVVVIEDNNDDVEDNNDDVLYNTTTTTKTTSVSEEKVVLLASIRQATKMLTSSRTVEDLLSHRLHRNESHVWVVYLEFLRERHLREILVGQFEHSLRRIHEAHLRLISFGAVVWRLWGPR